MHKIKNKNKFEIFSFVNRGISIYNNLSSPFKKAKNTNIFKTNLKKMLLNKQLNQIGHYTNKKPNNKFKSIQINKKEKCLKI